MGKGKFHGLRTKLSTEDGTVFLCKSKALHNKTVENNKTEKHCDCLISYEVLINEN